MSRIQLQANDRAKEKYLYDVEAGQFRDAPNRINELLKDPEYQAYRKASDTLVSNDRYEP